MHPTTHPWSGWRHPAFSEAQESEFQNQYASQIATFFRVFHPYGVVLYLGFLFWDWTLAPEVLEQTAPWRIAAALSILAVTGLTFHRSFVRLREPLCLGITMVAALVLAYVLYLVPRGFELGTSGMMLCLIFSLGMWRLRPSLAVVAYASILITCNALMALKGSDRATVATTNMMLVSAFGLCLLYHHLLELQSRRFFLLESRLRTEKGKIESLLQEVKTERQERLEWLENLASFLRHELSNQMIGVRSSLDLLERRAPEAGSQAYVDRARRSVHVMQRLLESAGEATSVETMMDEDEFEAFDVSEVVEVWGELARDVSADRRIEIDVESGLWVRGAEDRVVQVLDKLMRNALEHADPAGRIDIAVRRDGHSAILEVRSQGDALPEDRERIFQPFVSGPKRQRGDQNLGIGLYVARLVSERLGGQLSAQPLSPECGACFRVSLPLVLPAQELAASPWPARAMAS